MSALRLLAIGFIFLCTAIAWSILGGSVVARTGQSDYKLEQEVMQLWGGRHEQAAPKAYYTVKREVFEDVQERNAEGATVTVKRKSEVLDQIALPLEQSRVRVDLLVDHRRKGLLWYPTYAVTFKAGYKLHNSSSTAEWVFAEFPFPSSQALYDGFVLKLNGSEGSPQGDFSKGATVVASVPAGGEALVEVAYRSRGLGAWSYQLAPGVGLVRDFQLEMTTNVERIDFPAGAISPVTKTRTPEGWRLDWTFASLVTGQKIALDPPNRLNPGPLAARITFFAPVGLLFFMTVLVMLGVLQQKNLHPMNYFFLSAAFFAFHLLLAYLVDHLDVNASFAIASLASLFLVATYLRLVLGPGRALLRAALAQLVFLVLFSYAFFFEGYTGLTVTIGAVLTLFVLMQLTGRVDWSDVFARRAVPQETGTSSTL